ncbi:Hpt domain-containing protein [Sphingomonas sp.]|uniref:Hpt domain-containing protein n=1 Tax=Sphingomonas sp. TaxID=28214 RepID=UPI003B001500
MAYDPGAIEATLAAAVGDDPALIVELRIAFVESAAAALTGLDLAAGPEAWVAAAGRLKGLAASFGAVRLMALASEAVKAGAPDPQLLGRIRRMVARL